MDSLNLETIIGICLGAGGLCIAVILGGGFIFLFNLRDRKRRQAAQAWNSTTAGRVIDSRVADRAYFQLGISQEEAEAHIKKRKEDNKTKPEDALAAVLSLFGDPGELAGDFLTSGGQHDSGDWPLIVYEYEVSGVKYLSNRVRVEDKHGPTMGGILYSGPLLKRYPKGATVTVYYNSQDPKESALER